jgi:hypothetical protein
MRRVILLFFTCLATGAVLAQKQCASTEYATQLANTDPSIKENILQAESFVRSYRPEILSTGIDHTGNASLPVITIPVVVHILYKDASQNITDDKVKQQIDVLNKAFRLSSPDTSKIPSYFQQLAGDCRVEFVLARVDPLGRATTGILRKSTWVTLYGMDDRIKYSSQGGDDAWDCNKYLNVWVGSLAGGIAGYSSPLGGPKDRDGVAIRTDAFGVGGGAVYNGGKTLVHEVGHWLGLRHIWGDANCGDDGVDDTPQQQGPNRGCPSGIRITCNNGPYGDMYNNYMDQVNDDCMLLFSKGQVARMRATFAAGGPHYALLSSNGYTGTPVVEPPVENRPSANGTIKSLQLYPNPVQKKLIVQFQPDVDCIGKEMYIVNEFGQVIRRITIQQFTSEVDVNGLQPGMYFIKVAGANKNILEKFLKQ